MPKDEALEDTSSEASELEEKEDGEVVLPGVPWDSAWPCLRQP